MARIDNIKEEHCWDLNERVDCDFKHKFRFSLFVECKKDVK